MQGLAWRPDKDIKGWCLGGQPDLIEKQDDEPNFDSENFPVTLGGMCLHGSGFRWRSQGDVLALATRASDRRTGVQNSSDQNKKGDSCLTKRLEEYGHT